jgi:hypothetical protein
MMGMGVDLKSLSLGIPWNQPDHGHVVLAYHMVHWCGKLEIVQSKIINSKEKARRRRWIMPKQKKEYYGIQTCLYYAV